VVSCLKELANPECSITVHSVFWVKKNHYLKIKSLDFFNMNLSPFVSGLWIIYFILSMNERSSKQFCLSSRVASHSVMKMMNQNTLLPFVLFSQSVISIAVSMSVVRSYIFVIILPTTEAVSKLSLDECSCFCPSIMLNIRVKVHQILEQAGITSFALLAAWLSCHIQ
jgi:hypothetical protein